MLAPKSPSISLPSETIALARAVIGATLLTRDGDRVTGGRIVESEAYPPGDPASHAFPGLRPRNTAMFGDPWHAYVYRIYGISWCFNITSEVAGIGGGVLIRALEPLQGLDWMAERRGIDRVRDLCRGPGRLCVALGIDGSVNGARLDGDRITLTTADPGARIGCSTRIGLTKAPHEALRFYLAGSPFLSGPRSLSP